MDLTPKAGKCGQEIKQKDENFWRESPVLGYR